jgi:hypothetical protein
VIIGSTIGIYSLKFNIIFDFFCLLFLKRASLEKNHELNTIKQNENSINMTLNQTFFNNTKNFIEVDLFESRHFYFLIYSCNNFIFLKIFHINLIQILSDTWSSHSCNSIKGTNIFWNMY